MTQGEADRQVWLENLERHAALLVLTLESYESYNTAVADLVRQVLDVVRRAKKLGLQ